MAKKQIERCLIGAGQRGIYAYAPYLKARPQETRFVAVAEPDPERRARFAQQQGNVI